MAKVSFSEALSYGFSLIGYFLAVLVVGGGLVVLGSIMGSAGIFASNNGDEGVVFLGIFCGVLMLLFGWLTIIAGSYGAIYKVIADGVNRGTKPTSNQHTETRVYSPNNSSSEQSPEDLEGYKLSNLKGKW